MTRPFWGEIIGAALGAGASFFGAKDQNKANQAVAASQMAFQERMSGSAYQRAVKDMRLAGINPMLAYSKGGATTPGGAGLPMANTMGGVSKVVSSALQLRRLNAETEKIEADTQLSRQSGTTQIYNQVESAARSRLYDAQGSVARQNITSAKAKAAGARIEQKIDESAYGEIMRHIQRLNPLRPLGRGK